MIRFSRVLIPTVLCALLAGYAQAAEAVKASAAGAGMVSREGENTLVSDKKLKEEEAARAKRRAAYTLPGLTDEEKKMEGTVQSLTGTIAGVSKFGVSIEENSGDGVSSDLWFRFTKEVKFAGVKTASELKTDDKVSVKYKLSKDKKTRLTLEVALLERPEPKPEAAVPAAEEEAPAQEVTP